MGKPPILYRESGGGGRLRRKEKETKDAPKANISHTKHRNEETKQSKGIKVKHAVFVYVTNDTQINEM